MLRIHETSGGNPFYALELARAMSQQGFDTDVTLPTTLTGLVGSKIGGLAADSAYLYGALHDGAESEFGLQSFKEILDTGALSFVMADVKHCGGISVGRAIGELAGSCGVKLAPHNPSGPVATVASMHVCLATPAFEILEYQWGEVPEREKMVTPGEGFDHGWLVPSGKAGLGVALDHEGLAAHASSVTKLAG